jgi:FkbM family methyltransferase
MRVREQLYAAERERTRLEQNLRELSEAVADRDRLAAQLAETIADRDRLAATFIAVRSARANISSMLESSQARNSELEDEISALRGCVSALESEREHLKAELDADRRAVIDRVVKTLQSELVANQSARDFSTRLTVLHAQVIECLSQTLLDRKPLAEDVVRYCRELEAGRTYEWLVNDILLSLDGRKDRRNRERFARTYDNALPFPVSMIREQIDFSIVIVDVGAQLLEMMDHVYAPMLRDRLCTVIGFEPLEREAEQRALFDPAARILPYFIGDGENTTFHINAYNPTSSLYPSNPEMSKFKGLSLVLLTKSTEPASTRRLDDIPEVESCDYLKVDVQGAELKVLSGAQRLLKSVSAVHIEVEFDQVYLGQPLFSDIDRYLREAGFELIDLFAPGYETYQKAPPGCGGSRLLWNDALYMKRDDHMTNEMLLKAAYIAHANYRKYDLAAHLLAIYDRRLKTDLYQCYVDSLTGFQPKEAVAGKGPSESHLQANQRSLP